MTDRLAATPEGARELEAVELIATADQLARAGDLQLAAALYRTWIDHNPDSDLLYAINFNLGSLLTTLGDLEPASLALAEAIRLKPDFLPPYINLAMALERLGRPGDAVLRLYDVVNRLGFVNGEAIGHKTASLKQLGRMLGANTLDSNAEQALKHSLDIAPYHRDVLQHWLSLRQRQCRWPLVDGLANIPRARAVAGFAPLSLAAYTDDPLLQLATAADYARNEVGRPARSLAASHRQLLDRARPDRLRIGYLSSDLREHAIGTLIAEVFELHDRSAVEVFAYYCGHRVGDAMHQRIKGAVDCWVDISGMTDEQAGERMVADEIHILVDVNGYTHSARTGVLAMRPAPVIVNWLGFPGTMGTPYHSHIIADDVIIPPENEIYYSETVKRLPCYQPNDRQRMAGTDAGSRQGYGLPEDATVFCCFNSPHKITPHTWRRWMKILHAVDGSVLWLLDGVPSTNAQLREHAASHGIAPDRIFFAPKLVNSYHLARYALVDLFLDTTPYGAHTTGSDALWMGTPVLTLPGRCFASRVSSSLVTAAGLPELVCRSSEEYVARAIELGRDREKLAALRARLVRDRDTCVLFDTRLLTSRLEQLFREMWDETVAGTVARPDLANLPIYSQIGAELDRDDVEIGMADDYREIYLRALADRDSFEMIPHDGRLWSK